jgi:hypothetical protein
VSETHEEELGRESLLERVRLAGVQLQVIREINLIDFFLIPLHLSPTRLQCPSLIKSLLRLRSQVIQTLLQLQRVT